jgi:hypothetical protein
MSDPLFHKQCLREIAAQIRCLGLEWLLEKKLDAKEVRVRRQPFKVEGNQVINVTRGIVVHPEREDQNAGTNRSEDVGYGCGVTMFIPADHSSDDLGPVTEWREIISRKFRNIRLTNVRVNVGHVCICTVEPADFAKDFKNHEYEISSLLIRVWARETRS